MVSAVEKQREDHSKEFEKLSGKRDWQNVLTLKTYTLPPEDQMKEQHENEKKTLKEALQLKITKLEDKISQLGKDHQVKWTSFFRTPQKIVLRILFSSTFQKYSNETVSKKQYTAKEAEVEELTRRLREGAEADKQAGHRASLDLSSKLLENENKVKELEDAFDLADTVPL